MEGEMENSEKLCILLLVAFLPGWIAVKHKDLCGHSNRNCRASFFELRWKRTEETKGGESQINLANRRDRTTPMH